MTDKKNKSVERVIIIAKRKSEYDNFLDEDIKIAKCKNCGEEIIYGDLVERHAKETANKKKASQEIKFICNQCYMKMPKMGKLMRPSQEMMDRMRADGLDIDEISIRNMMRKIKNKKV